MFFGTNFVDIQSRLEMLELQLEMLKETEIDIIFGSALVEHISNVEAARLLLVERDVSN